MRLSWLKIYIGNLAVLNEQFRDENGAIDFDALGREEYEFRRAVIIGDFSRSERAREIYELCEEEFVARSEAGKKNARKRWKKLSADATTREDVENVSDGDTAANLESRPSADTLPTVNEGTKKHPHGEFNNVMLTTDEYTKWIMSGEDADALLEELSSYLASSGKKYKNHYATLLNWRRRKSKEKKDAPKSFAQQDAERREYQLTHSILDKVAL